MSRLTDYSRFDHLDSDLEDSDDERKPEVGSTSAARPNTSTAPASSQVAAAAGPVMRRKSVDSNRIVFEFDGKTIYEWEQTLDDVTIYVPPPPHISSAGQIRCDILPNRLRLGVASANRWFIDEETFSTVEVGESTWTLDQDDSTNSGRTISIYLVKAHRGQLWESVLKGAAGRTASSPSSAALDPMLQQQIRRDLLVERFQEENPGFDFRSAEFNGDVPDARTYMGGVKHQ